MDSHTFSAPILVEDSTKDTKTPNASLPTWKVDVIRCGSNRAVVGTLYINNNTLPPRFNKKGKMAWKLPTDTSKETPKFGPPEQKRLWELYKQQKKERRKQQNNTNGSNGNKIGTNGSTATNGDTTSTTSSSEADSIKTKTQQEQPATEKGEPTNKTTLASGSRPSQQQMQVSNPRPPPSAVSEIAPTTKQEMSEIATEPAATATEATTTTHSPPSPPPPPPGFTTASSPLDTSTLPLRSFSPPPPPSSVQPPAAATTAATLLHEWALTHVLPQRNTPLWPLYYRDTAPLTFLVHSAQAVASTRTERQAAAANFRNWTVQGWTIAEIQQQQEPGRIYQIVMTGTTVSVSQGGQWMVFTSTIVLTQQGQHGDDGDFGYVIDRDVTTLFAV